jgi:RimJ/RimL family protein N-acetyltransferase
MFRPRLPIETERLRLRAWSMDDVDAFASLYADTSVVRFLYDEPLSHDAAAVRLAEYRDHLPGPDRWMNLVVELGDGGHILGTVGLNQRSDVHRQVELGYVFSPASSGQGYATEAASAMVSLAFDQVGAHRVFARLDARNGPSARLCERLGFRKEALLLENEFVKGEWCDELTYATLEEEWRQRGRAGGGPIAGP